MRHNVVYIAMYRHHAFQDFLVGALPGSHMHHKAGKLHHVTSGLLQSILIRYVDLADYFNF
jgi:hypothetical protein